MLLRTASFRSFQNILVLQSKHIQCLRATAKVYRVGPISPANFLPYRSFFQNPGQTTPYSPSLALGGKLGSLEAKIEVFEPKIMSIEQDIRRLNVEIQEIERHILKAEDSGAAERKVEQLCDEENKLRDAQNKLRDEKNKLRDEKNMLVKKALTDSGEKPPKKVFRVFDEHQGKVVRWSARSDDEFNTILAQNFVQLFSTAHDSGSTRLSFEDIESESKDDLRQDNGYKYVAKPTIFGSKLEYANQMARNVADIHETDAGRWVAKSCGTAYNHGFFHQSHRFQLELHHPSWKNEKDKIGVREVDALSFLEDVGAMCMISVKTRVNQADLDVLSRTIDLGFDPSVWKVRLDPNTFEYYYPMKAGKVVADVRGFAPFSEVLPEKYASSTRLPFIGILVTAIPNNGLTVPSNVLLVERDQDFVTVEVRSGASSGDGNYQWDGSLVDAVKKVVNRQ